MVVSERIHGVSFVKARMAELLEDLPISKQPVIITQNGEGRAVLLDLRTHQQTQETLAMLKLVAMGDAEVASGRTVDARAALASMKRVGTDAL